MKGKNTLRLPFRIALLGFGLLATVGITGCQVDQGGQTLPSGYYMSDDVQYYAPSYEFKHQKEAAAQKAFNQEQAKRAQPATTQQ